MKKDIDRIIALIAQQKQISEDEVLKEMQEAIDFGYYNPDPAVREEWAAMPFQEKPTPQEFIAYMADRLSGNKMKH